MESFADFGPKVASFVSGPIKTVETSSSGESELFGFPSDSKSSEFLEFPAGIAGNTQLWLYIHINYELIIKKLGYII